MGWNTDPSANTFQGVKLRETGRRRGSFKPVQQISVSKKSASKQDSKPRKDNHEGQSAGKGPFIVISLIILIMAFIIYFVKMDSIEDL